MTNPDLAAFRALVEVASLRRNTQLRPPEEFAVPDDWIVVPRADFDAVRAALPAAQEALERVEGSITLMDTNNYSGVLKSSSVALAEQAARLARLEEALLLARNVVRHAQMADPTHVEEYQEIEARCDAALEGRDG